MHIAHLARAENELLASGFENELRFVLREDMRGAIVLLRQFLLPLQHFAGQANDHVVLIDLSVDRDVAECGAFDFHGLTFVPILRLSLRRCGRAPLNAIGEFERIVMWVRLLAVDLPESSYLLPDLSVVVFYFVLEREFRARKQTNRNVGLPDRCEPARDRVAKPGRYQSLANLRRAGCDKIQTVVAHGSSSSATQSQHTALL